MGLGKTQLWKGAVGKGERAIKERERMFSGAVWRAGLQGGTGRQGSGGSVWVGMHEDWGHIRSVLAWAAGPARGVAGGGAIRWAGQSAIERWRRVGLRAVARRVGLGGIAGEVQQVADAAPPAVGPGPVLCAVLRLGAGRRRRHISVVVGAVSAVQVQQTVQQVAMAVVGARAVCGRAIAGAVLSLVSGKVRVVVEVPGGQGAVAGWGLAEAAVAPAGMGGRGSGASGFSARQGCQRESRRELALRALGRPALRDAWPQEAKGAATPAPHMCPCGWGPAAMRAQRPAAPPGRAGGG